MAMKLKNVVPFGRSFNEYSKMFNLTNFDLKKKIIGIADGPASFNAEATKMGIDITSIDPIYQFSTSEIKQRFDEVVDNIIAQVKATPDDWVWTYHQSPEDLRNNRRQALNYFLTDYELGKQQSRYQIGQLPQLDFQEKQFELALCSHFLFLYSEHHDYQFHQNSIQEMLRVAQEVRIFPLLTLMLTTSPYLESTLEDFRKMGYEVKLIKVEYELQKGGNQMLVIKTK